MHETRAVIGQDGAAAYYIFNSPILPPETI
jgi:hypothetical protein